jgi:transcription elongation factor GreA
MIMSGVNYVTKETLEQMKEELAQLKTVGRAEIARQIAEAREKGDLKENAEYDAAKEAQGYHEAKIAQLEAAVASARIIDAKDIDTSKVSILSRVKLTNLTNKKTFVYQIVSETEADLSDRQRAAREAGRRGRGSKGARRHSAVPRRGDFSLKHQDNE